MTLSKKISDWINERVEIAGAKGCVVGLSGGVDSSVVAVLCKKAFPKNTLGVIMPCFSNPADQKHAKELAQKFNIETVEVDLSESLESLYRVLEKKKYSPDTCKGLACANIRPRLRMTTLYYFANKNNYIVVGTGNKSEIVMGYFTKYGDGGVDLEPLGGLLKKKVKALAAELQIPQAIIDKSPSAGLWSGQTDEGEMGIAYAELDKIIEAIEAKKENVCDPKMLEKVKRIMTASRHKSCAPPIFEGNGF